MPVGMVGSLAPFPEQSDDFYSILEPGIAPAGEAVELPEQPRELGPVYDLENFHKPMKAFSKSDHDHVYGSHTLLDSETSVPPCPDDFHDEYLSPSLTKNEQARLKMLWYYTHGMNEDTELLQKLTHILETAKQSFGWEIGIIGLVDANEFTRVVTANTIAVETIPRRESPCSHTVNQYPTTVLTLQDMLTDWRFKDSPAAKYGGLRSYAGTQIQILRHDGEVIVFGSVCLSSRSLQVTPTDDQKKGLLKAANLISSELVTRMRLRRLAVRASMTDSLNKLRHDADNADDVPAMLLEALSQRYKGCQALIYRVENNSIKLNATTTLKLEEVDGGLWDNTVFIDECIHAGKTSSKAYDRPVRAVIGHIRDSERLLVCATSELRFVFDDLDAWFLDQCATLINSSAQSRFLKEAIVAKDKVLTSIRHELRTPIHGILSSVELLGEELNNRGAHHDSQLRALVQTIRSSGTELMRTVNNILMLNALRGDRTGSQSESYYDLQDLEVDVLGDVLLNYPEESLFGISIIFESNINDHPAFKLDYETLKEILKILMFNSLAATEQGEIVVTISFPSDHSMLAFDVVDTGIGVQLEDQQRIFEAFEKVKFHSKGAGLGLGIARLMSESMGGKLSLVSSQLGAGSHFRFHIPDIESVHKPELLRRHSPRRPRNLPPRYHVVLQSKRELHLVARLERHLKQRGMQPHDTMQGSVLVMNQPETSHVFDATALKDLKEPHVVFVVCQSDPADILGDFLIHVEHLIIPVRGPLYTGRLDALLVEAGVTLLKIKKPSPILQQTSSQKTRQVISLAELPRTNSDSSVQSISMTPPTTPGAEIDDPSTIVPRLRFVKALLVDDNNVNLSILQFYCKKKAISFGSAQDGNQAISLYLGAVGSAAETDIPFTLVLMDLQMPGCDGIEATRRIREFEQASASNRSVIFMVTGQDSVADRKKAYSVGVDEFFIKPISMKRLSQYINQYFPDAAI